MDGSKLTEADSRWTAPEKHELHWADWGAQLAVYDTRSGETHLLAEPTARVLHELLVRPGTARQVTESLCRESGEICNGQSLARIARLLLQLRDAGLVEKAGT